MFMLKKKYYLIISSIKDINLDNIKKLGKFSIIYRNLTKPEKKIELLRFRKKCKLKSIGFYIANDLKLATYTSSDGIYLSSYNKSYKALNLRKLNIHIIGSAHSKKEIYMKMKQGCEIILLSKLFIVDYDDKAPYLGVIKFNNSLNFNKNLIPLGGIKLNNLNSLNMVNCKGFALLSEVKKKPTNIISRLF
jgi:thiamine monophosphate synthase